MSKSDYITVTCDNCAESYTIMQYYLNSGFCNKCEELPLVRKIIQLQIDIDYLKSNIFNLRHYGDDKYGY